MEPDEIKELGDKIRREVGVDRDIQELREDIKELKSLRAEMDDLELRMSKLEFRFANLRMKQKLSAGDISVPKKSGWTGSFWRVIGKIFRP